MASFSGGASGKTKKLPTGKSLTAATSKANNAYKKQTSVVSGIQTKIKANQKIIDKADDFLNKTNGYKAANDAYKSQVSKVSSLETKLSKAKSSSTKKTLKNEIKEAKAKQTSAYKSLTAIKKSSDAKKQFTAKTSATKKNKSYAKTLKAAKAKQKKLKTNLDALKAKQKSEAAAALKKLQAKNQARINAKIKAQAGKLLKPQTAVWRADLKTDTVVFLGEISPTETNDADGPTNAVDSGDPRTNYLIRSGKTLSGTYYLFGTGGTDSDSRWANVDKHYDSLQKWQRWGLEVCIRGFSKWKHGYMTSIGKVSENKDIGAVQLSISFSYKKPANLVYRQKKTKAKSKGKKTTKSGKKSTSSKTAKSHTIKSGDTYSALAKKYGVSVSSLEKANKYPARSLPIGKKLIIK